MKPSGYWTYDRCKEAAFECETKSEFMNRFSGAYSKVKKMGWWDELSEHMTPLGDRFNRLVYYYEFSDNSIYVGITYDPDRRHRYHLNDERSKVYQHIIETNKLPIKKHLTEDFVPVKEAQKLENFWVKKFKENGCNILNVAKTGGLGGNELKWTKEKCAEEALKYNTRKEFADGNSSAYIRARRFKWLDDICSHMEWEKRPENYWTYETCKEAAKKCKTRFEFSRKYSRAHTISSKNGWLDEFGLEKIVHIKWTYEKCKELAKKCSSRSDFYRKYTNAYDASRRNKWLVEFFPNKLKG
ncbi:MAG: GIY-YIG nuclease family protein [bacterium]